jgi:hypothetical protein
MERSHVGRLHKKGILATGLPGCDLQQRGRKTGKRVRVFGLLMCVLTGKGGTKNSGRDRSTWLPRGSACAWRSGATTGLRM